MGLHTLQQQLKPFCITLHKELALGLLVFVVEGQYSYVTVHTGVWTSSAGVNWVFPNFNLKLD